MKVLVIGSGGREHAMVRKFAQSDRVEVVFAAPGNGGTAGEAKCQNLPVPGDDAGALAAFAAGQGIDLTVVGPEAPLAAGLVDRFRAAGLAVVGPDKKAARLEASKAYAKSFMEKYGVRTARSKTFVDPDRALDYAAAHFVSPVPAPLVIKADGLAAGKGVVIAESFGEAEETIRSFMRERLLGAAGQTLVLEEFLPGKEVSILAAVSVRPRELSSAFPGGGGRILPFVSARDHKRRFEGGLGPNTGGMGAIAPAPDFSAAAGEDFRSFILEPTLRGMEAEALDYRGFIFFGLMVNQDRCSLLEYNVRLGDPETQAVLPLLETDFGELCAAILAGTLGDFPLRWKPGAVCAPVLVAEGYPGPCRKGDLIRVNWEKLAQTGVELFAAGARRGKPPGEDPAGLYTAGGRVLALSAWGVGPEEARARAYAAVGAVDFTGMAYRSDIGGE
ncbi:MAG: phosphoribosylamine--glycine ligase [Spirochaetaceae bacterium]|jgi:phosphoribosylamine--glycine ligase|nr:phosphoribosylamine--glycine ligase [Spirochaetaceae bacterium]